MCGFQRVLWTHIIVCCHSIFRVSASATAAGEADSHPAASYTALLMIYCESFQSAYANIKK